MKKRLNEIRKIRLDRVKRLREMGIDPYPAKVDGNPIPIKKVRLSYSAKTTRDDFVEVVGRIWGWRAHGNVIFADLKDDSGEIQLWFQKDNLKDFKILKLLDVGDFIFARGPLTNTKAGELTIDVTKFQLLTKSIRPLPTSWSGFKDVEERYRQRYVDLAINKDVRAVFEARSKIVAELRRYLEKSGYVEVKTPVLQPIYGGATAKPFITHYNALDHDFFLRIADELYLKRLIVGGYHKVYELGTDFRNEGIGRWNIPEFSMLEFYWAYADYEDLMVFTEEMLSEVVKKVTGGLKVKYGENIVDFKTPWERITYREAIKENTGIDIDKVKNMDELKKAIKDSGKKINLKGINNLYEAVDEFYKKFVRKNIINPTFLIDHPFYMRPLAKKKAQDPTKVESIQPIVAGAELLNAYTELNDPVDQRERWEEEMKRGEGGSEEYQVIDDDYIRALEYGMPPTAGWGMGIDRFTAILTNQHSIKDTILFPTLRPKVTEKKKK